MELFKNEKFLIYSFIYKLSNSFEKKKNLHFHAHPFNNPAIDAHPFNNPAVDAHPFNNPAVDGTKL